MALVVLLRAVNVGGHRSLRPRALAEELERFDVINVGAAGTFVVREPVSRAKLRTEIGRLLPFRTDVMICGGSEILRLTASDPFAGHVQGPDLVRFVGFLARDPGPAVALPLDLPGEGDWSVRVLARRGRLALGLYRRQMKAIRFLGHVEKVFGVPVTIRNWNTILAVARVLRPPSPTGGGSGH